MNQVLFIFTANYPYANGEPYLEHEMKVIWPHFKRIIIVNTSTAEDTDYCYFVPPNATLLRMPMTLGGKLALLWFFLRHFWDVFKEMKVMIQDYQLRISLNNIKIMLASGLMATNLSKKLASYMVEHDLTHDCTLYSYWCDDSALAIALLKKKFPRVNAVSRLHAWDLFFERQSGKYLPFRHTIFSHMDMLYPISDVGKSYLLSKFPYVRADKVSISRLGSPGMRKEAYNTPISDTVVILSLSFIVPLKRLDKIIQALARVKSRNVVWYHIGGGPEKENLEKMAAREFQDTRVREWYLLDNLSREEIIRLFEEKTFDCLINASDTEGVPVSMMEALSAGIPVIGPEVGGIPEIIIDGENGYLVRSEDPAAYTAAIEHMIALSDDAYLKLREQAYQSWFRKYNSEYNFASFAQMISIDKK